MVYKLILVYKLKKVILGLQKKSAKKQITRHSNYGIFGCCIYQVCSTLVTKS